MSEETLQESCSCPGCDRLPGFWWFGTSPLLIGVIIAWTRAKHVKL